MPDFDRREFLAAAASAVALPACSREPGPIDRVRGSLGEMVDKGALPGFAAAIFRDGELTMTHAGRRAVGGASIQPDDIFRVASITKPVTAVAAMVLVEEGRLGLDKPVADLLPEIARPSVLRHLAAPLTDTVPAVRPITLRHLLTQTNGLGAIMMFPPKYPIQTAIAEAGFTPGYELPNMRSDMYMQRIGALPLAAQPGEQFLYNMGLDLAGVLVARAAQQSLGSFLVERIFGPLGMADTGFAVPPASTARLATLYTNLPGKLTALEFDPTPFESGAGGLVSTAADYMKFARLLLGGGSVDGKRILSPDSMRQMMTPQLTAEQLAGPNALPILGRHSNWGLGAAVDSGGGPLGLPKGAFGWHGGYGTSAYVDPKTGTAGVLLTNLAMSSPEPPEAFRRFWRALYPA